MEHYAGIDVSLELSSVCVVDATGRILKEAKISSEPATLVAFFGTLGFAVKRIGRMVGMSPPVKVFGCRPLREGWRAHGRPASENLQGRKPREGRRGRFVARYGGFEFRECCA